MVMAMPDDFNPNMPEPPEEYDGPICCKLCNDTGWIVVRTSFPMSYVGPGPCPEDATGVINVRCRECR